MVVSSAGVPAKILPFPIPSDKAPFSPSTTLVVVSRCLQSSPYLPQLLAGDTCRSLEVFEGQFCSLRGPEGSDGVHAKIRSAEQLRHQQSPNGPSCPLSFKRQRHPPQFRHCIRSSEPRTSISTLYHNTRRARRASSILTIFLPSLTVAEYAITYHVSIPADSRTNSIGKRAHGLNRGMYFPTVLVGRSL